MKLSNIIGKQVFDIYNSKIWGTINEAVFDERFKKILGFYFFDEEENEYYIKTQNIYSVLDFVTIKNSTKISNDYMLNKPLSPLGKKIIGTDGKDYGVLNNLELDDKYNILEFVSNKECIKIDKIISVSSCIVVGEINLCKFKPKNKKTFLNDLTISVMKMDEPETNFKLMPSKITVNSDILIGKKLSKDIIGKNNELILKQNQTITPKQVILAKQHEKLNELFYSVY